MVWPAATVKVSVVVELMWAQAVLARKDVAQFHWQKHMPTRAFCPVKGDGFCAKARRCYRKLATRVHRRRYTTWARLTVQPVDTR